MYPYSPQALDEHELIQGDFMIVDPNKIQDCKDGWPLGLSWLSGTEGHFPLNYTEKTAESETWTMHRSDPIIILMKTCISRMTSLIEMQYKIY